MATSPMHTIVTSPACPAVAAALTLASDTQANGDTLIDVIKDDVRRNKLIDDNNLLKGVRMTAEGPVLSVLELVARPSTLHGAIDQNASILTTISEAEYTETLVEENYVAASIKVSAPFVTAGADYSRKSTWKNTATTKTASISSHLLFPQGHIDFAAPGSGYASEIELSQGFTAALDAALGKATPAEKREALDQLFNEYGHVFRSQVRLGGMLSVNTTETYSRTENETSVKTDISASLEVSVQQWGAGISARHGNVKERLTTAEGRKIQVQYRVRGGHFTKIQDIKEWIASSNDSKLWRVVEVSQAVSIVDLLPEPKRTAVQHLLRPLLGQWVPVKEVANISILVMGIYQPKNSLPPGWFWLGHTADESRALIVQPALRRKAGRNYAIANVMRGSGASKQPQSVSPGYELLSTYFGEYDPSTPLGETLAALRPGLCLEGNEEGGFGFPPCSIVIPKLHPNEEDECLNLRSFVQAALHHSSDDNSPKSTPRWVIRKSAILFDSGET